MSSAFRLGVLSTLLGVSPFLFAAEALQGANGLELTEFAREPMVRNAVAVTVDEQERVFVTSVVRRQAADLDIRRFREWIEADLSLTSVAEKRQWFEQQLTPANSALFADRFEDTNGDGRFDFADLSLLADQISRLEDTDGDGRADRVITFNAAENSAITGIAAGLAAWDGALYATVEPDLMRLVDTDGDGVPDERTSLAQGFSVHIGYGGHNFSGAIIGPDGRLYASVADRGLHVTDRAGNTHANPLSGAIVRCELDGSHFEIYATGLRNVQEPAFNAVGDLIGVDNDGDFEGEKERLIFIAEGSDTGWRTHWQYRGKDWLPWMDEGMAFPHHPDQPAFITPPLQLYKDGPAGFAFNPGTALNPFYRDYFFMSAFPSRNLYAFRLEPDGVAYRMVGEHTVTQGVLMVGMGFGPSGALYLADWSSSGYAMNQRGAVWKLDDPQEATSALRQSTARLIAQDWSQPATETLESLLTHPDQRVRMKAQFELVHRAATDPLVRTARDDSLPQPARLHAIWGIGQFLRQGTPVPADILLAGLNDSDAEIRAQVAKILGEAPDLAPELTAALIEQLADDAPRPRFFAALALARLQGTSATAALIHYVENDAADPWHRHAGSVGLASCAPPERLAALATHPDREVRRTAIVALRRQGSPAVTAFLADADPLVVAEAASAIHDDTSIPAALPALAELLAHPVGLHERTTRRALSAALRLRDAPYAGRVANFALNADAPRELRRHALRLLQTWPAPPRLDTVEGRYRPLESQAVAELAPAVAAPLTALSTSPDLEIAEIAWTVAAAYGIQPSFRDLQVIVEQDTSLSAAALAQLDAMNAVGLPETAATALQSKHRAVRGQALRTIARVNPTTLVAVAQPFFDASQIPESRLAINLMAASEDYYARRGLRGPVADLVRGELDPALALDVLVAAQSSEDHRVRAMIAAYQESKDATDPLSAYAETLAGGDPRQGQVVFETSVAAQCTLCHRIGDEGSEVGPALTHIGEKSPRYLLEALVLPGAVVAPGYGFTAVTLQNGENVSGTLMAETKTLTTLQLADGTPREIDRSTIASRTPEMSSMPPMGALMNRFELRDLLAYLQTLR